MLRWFPENVSTFGGEIDGLFALIYWIVGGWFLLAEGILLLCVLRFRRRARAAATYRRGERTGELAWLLAPALVILALDLAIEAAGGPVWARIKEQQPADALPVRVTAKQFNWEITYPGPDGQFETADDLTLENELHVPVGRNVQLMLQSKDVIHSFFVPNLRLKQDIIPGRVIPAWFNATKPGTYEMPCAELCGFGHSGMRGFLTVHPEADYRRWLDQRWPQSAGAGRPASAG
jgi:cytochrome c oxidase subunit 2